MSDQKITKTVLDPIIELSEAVYTARRHFKTFTRSIDANDLMIYVSPDFYDKLRTSPYYQRSAVYHIGSSKDEPETFSGFPIYVVSDWKRTHVPYEIVLRYSHPGVTPGVIGEKL